MTRAINASYITVSRVWDFHTGGHYMCVPGFLKVVCGMKLKIFLVGPCGVRGGIYCMGVRGSM